MTLSRRLILLLITVLPVLVLLVWIAFYLKDQVNQLASRSNVLAANELQRRFDKQVRIGSMRISPGVIVLQDVRVSRGKTFADGTLISVPRLFIHYDWRDLIGGKGAGAISDIAVMRPRAVLIRRADGSFNIADLLKPPPGPRRPPFRGLVKVSGAEVTFIDYAVLPGRTHGPLSVHDVNGIVDAARYPVYTFRGTAEGSRGQFDRVAFSGSYHSDRKRVVVDARARGVSAPIAMPYAWRSRNVQVTGGKLDITAVLDRKRTDSRSSVTVNGRVRVHNASVRTSLLRAPVTDLSGTMTLAGDRAGGSLTAVVARSPFRITGSVVNFRNPSLNVATSSTYADFPQLIRVAPFLSALSQFSPSGRGPVDARITGSLANPVVDVTASVPRAAVRGVAVRNVTVAAKYRRGRVDIRSARLTANGAAIAASGYVTTGAAPHISLRGRFSRLNLRSLPDTLSVPVTGIASGTFSLSGRTASPSVSASIRVIDGSVSGTPFASADARVRLVDGQAIVSGLRLTTEAGEVLHAQGTVTPRSINLTASAASIDIAGVAARFGETGYSGTAFFNGRITGSPRSPQVDGTLEAFDVGVNGYTIDRILVQFSANPHSATINEAIVQVFPAEARFTAELTGLDQSRVSFSGRGNVQRLEVTKLLELLDAHADVTGTIVGDVTFSGVFLPRARRGTPRVVGVVASGNLSVEDASALEYPISSASATLDYSNNVLRISNATVVSDKAVLGLNGTLATDTYEVKAGFDLTGFELARLHEYLGEYLVLAGTASASGTVSGVWEHLSLSVSAKADNLAVNYERFDSAGAELTYADGKYQAFSASLVRGTQKLVLAGSDFDPETVCLASATGSVEDVSIPDIWAILRASPYFSTPEGRPFAARLDQFPKIASGRVNGSFNITGCLEAPNGSIALSATNIGLDVEKIESIDLQASAKSGVVTIGTLRAVSGDMTVDVAGAPAYDNGNLNLEIRAENLQLSRLEPWLGSRTPGGTLSALFAVQGPVSAPDIVGSAEVVSPRFDGFALDQLRASSIRITSSRIEIPDILLTAAGYQATASASVPWNWSMLAVPNDEPIHLSVDLSAQSLAILNVLGPMVDTAKTTGTASEAWFRLDGTLLDPELSGSVKVTKGTVALTGFSSTFDNVNVDLAFVADRLVVNAMSATSSMGGSLYVVPGGYITAGILGPSEINLQVVADRLRLAERNALGLREDVTTQVDAGLSVTGPLAAPMVADRAVDSVPGGITLSNARLAFQMASKGTLWQAAPFINPAFNVSLRLGDDVVVSPPSMSLTVTGGGTLTGTLAQPVVRRLELNVLSGDIGLATARLRVIPGGHIYITYAPPAPPDIQVDLQATTSVFAINALRQRQRYQITMMITGQAANPQINLSSSPPGLTREQMLVGLGHLPDLFLSPEAGLQQELGAVLTAAGAQALFAPIENLLIQKLGFEQFTLDFSPQYPLSIYVSRHLFGNYYLSFYRQLRGGLASTQDTLYIVTLSYRKGMYEFSIGADDEQTLSAQIGYAKTFW